MGQRPSADRSPSSLLICALLLALCAFSSAATAQPKPAKNPPPVEFVGIDLGWSEVLAGDRWSPVTVLITSQRQAFSGVLSIDYGQDQTQDSRILVPIATTPGKVTPVQLVFAPPNNCERVRFDITDERGRLIDRWDYARDLSSDNLPLPHVGARGGLVVTLSGSSARFASATGLLNNPEGQPAG